MQAESVEGHSEEFGIQNLDYFHYSDWLRVAELRLGFQDDRDLELCRHHYR